MRLARVNSNAGLLSGLDVYCGMGLFLARGETRRKRQIEHQTLAHNAVHDHQCRCSSLLCLIQL